MLTIVAIFADLRKIILMLLFLGVVWVTPALAHRSPDTCSGSGLAINLYTDKPQVHIGDTISYSVEVFNGAGGGPIVCDATDITAFIVTPDGVTHPIILARTSLSNLEVDSYSNVATYIARAEDVQDDGTFIATARDTGTIHQNDTDSLGGGFQGLNITVTIPATLHIIKQVINDNAGIATASLFNLHVKLSGTDVLGSPAIGTASPGTLYSLDAGAYIVSEDENVSYTRTFFGDCDLNGNVVLVAGGDKTCTIINDDIVPVVVPPPPSGGGGGGHSYTPPPVLLVASVVNVIPIPTPEPVPVVVVPSPIVVAVVSVPSLPKTGFFSDHASALYDNILLFGYVTIFCTALFVIFKKRTI